MEGKLVNGFKIRARQKKVLMFHYIEGDSKTDDLRILW